MLLSTSQRTSKIGEGDDLASEPKVLGYEHPMAVAGDAKYLPRITLGELYDHYKMIVCDETYASASPTFRNVFGQCGKINSVRQTSMQLAIRAASSNSRKERRLQ